MLRKVHYEFIFILSSQTKKNSCFKSFGNGTIRALKNRKKEVNKIHQQLRELAKLHSSKKLYRVQNSN